jgi:hypothetical protein
MRCALQAIEKALDNKLINVFTDAHKQNISWLHIYTYSLPVPNSALERL